MNPYRICLGCGVLDYSMMTEKCSKCGHIYKTTEKLNQSESNN